MLKYWHHPMTQHEEFAFLSIRYTVALGTSRPLIWVTYLKIIWMNPPMARFSRHCRADTKSKMHDENWEAWKVIPLVVIFLTAALYCKTEPITFTNQQVQVHFTLIIKTLRWDSRRYALKMKGQLIEHLRFAFEKINSNNLVAEQIYFPL